MELRWSPGRAAAAAHLAGPLVGDAGPALEALTTMARLLPFAVVVDLSAVTAADERGLLALRDAARRAGGQVSFVNPSPAVAGIGGLVPL